MASKSVLATPTTLVVCCALSSDSGSVVLALACVLVIASLAVGFRFLHVFAGATPRLREDLLKLIAALRGRDL
ncbi:hypothetical protein KLP28_08635 [Nocardioidaceae bacterium]|nr:hypothetical protein KLP28_08635 [Nocardioidaceae bacterium]